MEPLTQELPYKQFVISKSEALHITFDRTYKNEVYLPLMKLHACRSELNGMITLFVHLIATYTRSDLNGMITLFLHLITTYMIFG